MQYYGHSSRNPKFEGKSTRKLDLHCSKVSPEQRQNCGYSGISQEECESRDRCFDSSTPGLIWCFEKQQQRMLERNQGGISDDVARVMKNFDTIENAISNLAEMDSDKFSRGLSDVAEWWKSIVGLYDERR